MSIPRYVTVMPSAARLTTSLRDIGYEFSAAVADIVDNSIAAGATEVEVDIDFDGLDSTVSVSDDGCGMSGTAITEAFRFGSRRQYGRGELGRYGLGLKTASFSQCRVLTVVSRRSGGQRVFSRQMDLDIVEDSDQWFIFDPGAAPSVARARQKIREGHNTVVIWENLDRVLPDNRPESGWARRRIETAATKAAQHLSIVFHRYLEGSLGREPITIAVNGTKLLPWNPFALDEPGTTALPPLSFEIATGGGAGVVSLQRYVLPARETFSSPDEWERLAGPLKWNRQQGIYVYRADRLVQWGGWAGIRAIDEHTKLARVALNFDTDLDSLFNINVAKMRVQIPLELRHMLEKPIHEACVAAGHVYRDTEQRRGNLPVHKQSAPGPTTAAAAGAGLALKSAALQSGDYDALKRIAKLLSEQAPDVLTALGLNEL